MHVSSNPRVLIVDDEHIIADTLALILQQHGYDATAVYSGETAVEAARAQEPDIMISDVSMGAMNGIEAATRVSAILPRCRIILHTGQPLNSDRVYGAGDSARAFEVFNKPVHPRALLKLLDGCN